ncbi:MAG: hypothetical protein EAY81_04430 [Bacteroidetes bacterium]|nr:MAG: hypothetical protein EAY81_04430 [Bacteroidota bacterium]
MQFVYPLFLWALAAISIPIIIHLFHFRRYKKIVFSDIRFLKQLTEQNKSKQKLKDWLILLCRILAVSCLVLAFAQPFIPIGEQSKKSGQQHVSLFIDNSFSMNASGSDGPLIEVAKNKARAIVNAYPNNASFQLLTNTLSGAEQRFVSKSDALSRIDAIAPVAASAGIKTIVSRQKAGFDLESSSNRTCYFISDFQQSQFKIDEILKDTAVRFNFVPVPPIASQNISVDSVYTTAPVIAQNQVVTFHITVTNHGNEGVEGIVLNLKLNQVQKGLLNLNLAANESVTQSIDVKITDTTWIKGEASITDYPITFDDKLFFTLKPASANTILLITDAPNPYIEAIFTNDKQYQLVQNTYGNINYQQLETFQLVILNEPPQISTGLQTQLAKFLQRGGQLFIIPNRNKPTDVNPYCLQNGLPTFGNMISQSRSISNINTKHHLFNGVFKSIKVNTELPSIKKYFPLIKQSSTKGKAVILLNNDDVLLWQAEVEKGSIALLAVPLLEDYSSLPLHSLFVPLMINMSMGKKREVPLYHVINQTKQITLNNLNERTDKLIKLTNNKQEYITELYSKNGDLIFEAEGLTNEGWYDVAEQKSGRKLITIALNNNRNESKLQFLSNTDLEKLTQQLKHVAINSNKAEVLGAQITAELSGKNLWRWFIMAALFFILVEILLLKLK